MTSWQQLKFTKRNFCFHNCFEKNNLQNKRGVEDWIYLTKNCDHFQFMAIMVWIIE